MFLFLLILIPLLTGLCSFFLKANSSKYISLLSSIVSVCIVLYSFTLLNTGDKEISINHDWLPVLGSRFHIGINFNTDGISFLMVLLTAFVFPIIFIGISNKEQTNYPSSFYALMLLAQAGLMGVFLAKDGFLFYIFWELALIPVYFLSSMFGGEKRIKVTFKFFIYTFVGSLLMLVALLYIYYKTPVHSFSWDVFTATASSLSTQEQGILFWLLFIAFAIKMPIFPFHTWKPDAYEKCDTPITIVLSALMVKMGLFAVIRWLLPLVPEACEQNMNLIYLLSIIGIIYASCMAIVQTNIKRLLAYSSIAHIGLMCAAIFSHQLEGIQGAGIQMFNHGITITGLWLLVYIIEKKYKTTNLNELGGIGKIAPVFTIFLVVLSFANVALPLTNGFPGELLMFTSIFNSASEYAKIATVFASLGVVLSAVYTLTMVQKIAYGTCKTEVVKDVSINEWIALNIIIAMVLFFGFYPNALLQLIQVTK